MVNQKEMSKMNGEEFIKAVDAISKEKGIDKELAGRTASEYREGEYARALSIARKMSESSGQQRTA